MGRSSRRLLLPVTSGYNVPPGRSFMFTARSQLEDFRPDRILIKNAERWAVERLQGRRPVEPSATLFGLRAPEAPLRMSRIGPGGELEVKVRYVGPREDGEPFECCAFGATDDHIWSAPASTTSETLTVRASSVVERDRADVCLPLPARSEEFWPERLVIGDPDDWVVLDVRVNGRSCLVQSGDLPGWMFADGEANPPLQVGAVSPRDELAVIAIYVGRPRPEVRFEYDLSGPKYADRVSQDVMRLLPMSSGVNILPNTSAQITSRLCDYVPAGHGFRPRRIVLDRPEDWMIGDIKVGRISQFAQSGDVPGVAFSARATGTSIAFDPVPVGIDFTIIATYVGDSESGGAFVCGAAGDIIDLTGEPARLPEPAPVGRARRAAR